jgi:sulfur-oxidizing protein SoxY
VQNQYVSRRDILAMAGVGAVAITLVPFPVAATPRAVVTAIEKVIGSAAPKDGRISIILPEIAENGGVVPLKINVDSPMNQQDFVKSVHIFADGNPLPEVANYHLSPHNGKAEFSLRIRLAKTQKIIAVAEMNDGQVFIARREIKVTLGGCGG